MESLSNLKPSAKVFVTSAYKDSEPITSLLKAAACDKVKRHQLVSTPEEADVILFVENSRLHADYFYNALKNNTLVKRYPGKVFMYNPHDKPWFILPGLYASMPRRLFNEQFMVASPYIETINPYINSDFSREPKYLFSFDGTPNSGPRRKIMELANHPRGMVKATYASKFGNHEVNVKLRYAELMNDSKFVLSPKGAGTSSFRVFETMHAGRAPVVVSDDWVRPIGPAWDDFAIFIPESQVYLIPEILEREEHTWQERGMLARQYWDQFFAPDTIFNYFIDRILELQVSTEFEQTPLWPAHQIAFLKYTFRRLVIQNIKSTIPIFRHR